MDVSHQRGLSYERSEKFERLSQTIASNIKKLSQNVTSMSKMTSQLQTSQDAQELKNQLHQIQTYTQQLAKDTFKMIMELTQLPTASPADALSRDRLRDEYMTTLNAFQAIQREVVQKNKIDRKSAMQTVNNRDPFAPNDPWASSDVELNTVGYQQQLSQSARDLQELEEREQNIRQLETDIMDVNSIFKELGTMIHEQGTVVNSIESSVESAAHSVDSATVELATAATYKNKLRKKKIYLTIILIIVIAIILIIVFSR